MCTGEAMSRENQIRANNDFVDRFRRPNKRRFVTPEYIWHQRNEGKALDIARHETKGKGVGPSERCQIAERVKFSKALMLRSTPAQLLAYSFKVADQILSARRRSEKAKAVTA